MEEIFSKASVIRLLKAGLNKPNPANPERMMWTLEELDIPPPGFTEVVNSCKGNPAFPQGYQGVKYKNLARLETPKIIEEKVELTDPKDLAQENGIEFF